MYKKEPAAKEGWEKDFYQALYLQGPVGSRALLSVALVIGGDVTSEDTRGTEDLREMATSVEGALNDLGDLIAYGAERDELLLCDQHILWTLAAYKECALLAGLSRVLDWVPSLVAAEESEDRSGKDKVVQAASWTLDVASPTKAVQRGVVAWTA